MFEESDFSPLEFVVVAGGEPSPPAPAPAVVSSTGAGTRFLEVSRISMQRFLRQLHRRQDEKELERLFGLQQGRVRLKELEAERIEEEELLLLL